jgi:hypothetical protein
LAENGKMKLKNGNIKKAEKWKICHGYNFPWIFILKIFQTLVSYPPYA